jgi:hypothetical protein
MKLFFFLDQIEKVENPIDISSIIFLNPLNKIQDLTHNRNIHLNNFQICIDEDATFLYKDCIFSRWLDL